MPRKWEEHQPGNPIGNPAPPTNNGGNVGSVGSVGNERHRSEQAGHAGKPRPGYTFAARFGRVILKHGVAAIPSALYHFQGKLGLTAQQVWFVSYVLSHKWDEDLPYPSIAQMARCTGISDRMLRYRCNELHHLGYLQIYPRYGENGGQSSNYYDFANLFAQLEEILSHEPPRPNPIQEGGAPHVLPDPAQADYSFLARYGRVLLSYGIAAVPRALFTHQKVLELTAQQVWFICYVLSFQWDTALPYPSINKMAERTGYSKQQLHNIKGELAAKGYLHIERRLAEGGGNDTNLYDFSPLFDSLRQQLEPDAVDTHQKSGVEADVEPLSLSEQGTEEAQATAQPTRLRHRPSQPKHARNTPARKGMNAESSNGAAIELTRGPATEFTTPHATGLTTPAETRLTIAAATELSGIGKGPSARPLNRALPTGRKPGLPKKEAVKEEQINEDDSNQRSQKNKLVANGTNSSRQRYSPYIAGITSDLSRELGDLVHELSNIKQAINLWNDSGLEEGQFVDLMHEAKKLTRRYQSRPTWDAMNNKMAYYFTTLRDLVAKAGDE